MTLMTSGFRPILLLALAAVLPIVVFAGAISIVSWNQERDAAARDALAQVQRLSAAIDRELAAQVAVVKVLTELPALREGDFDQVDATLRRVQKHQPLWLSALVVTADGTTVVHTARPAPRPAIEVESLRELVEKREPLIGRVMMGKVNLGLPVRAPVIRDGRVTHSVTAVIRPDAIRDLLLGANFPRAWIGSVIDRYGFVVARTQGEDLLGKPASETALNAHERGGQGLRPGRTLEGIETVTAYVVSPNTGWSVHVGIPTDLYEVRLDRRFWTMAAGAVAALLLAAVFTFFLAREIRDRRREALALEQARRLEALGRLTGGIAADFNNLLTAIMGGVQILKRRLVSEDAARPLDTIERAAENGARTTRELLSFARGGTSRPRPLDLNDHLRNSAGMIRQAIGQSIATRFELAPNLPAIDVDAVQLNLALLNLASNARDAMGDDGTLRIATGTVHADGRDDVLLKVSDTGAGIAAEDLPNVFDPFFTTKKDGRGSGLGLAQVYGFAKQSGGAASIDSTPGHGTIVTLRLPACDAERAHAATEPAQLTAVPHKHEGRVLVADDHADVRAMIADWLRDLGYEVHAAAGAGEALAVLQQQDAIEIAIVEAAMPAGQADAGLAEEIRRRRPRLPIVVMSASGAPPARTEADDWIAIEKPFGFLRLASVVADALDLARLRGLS